MFCSRCGTEVQDGSQFCPSCGQNLAVTTPVKAIATGEMTEMDIVRDALAAEYDVQEELGRGGMAIVYRARERQLERDVAIKVLPFSLAFDAEFVERFQREARTAAQLEHPNIIPIYRVGRSGRVIYFVMKFLRGKALSQILRERDRLTPPEIRRLLLDAGSALGFAARNDVVHRDVKPDNIMFDEHGQCLLMDFGIAKAASGQKLTGTGMSIGTPHYMSPEQARAQTIDGRSDIYSLGIVAYLCLTGQVPYDGEDSFSIGYKHIQEPIPTPQLATADERRLFEVIKRMMMKDPNDRFQTCEELIAALGGQPMALPGSMGGARAATARIANQPTTPVPRSNLPPVAPPSGTRRGAAARAEAPRQSSAGVFVWLLLLAGAAGGGWYYLKVFQPQQAAQFAADSAAAAAARAAAHEHADTTLLAGITDPGLRPSDGSASQPRHDSAAPARTYAPADSGSLRLRGLPARTVVAVDGNLVTATATRLAAGPHELAITSPGYQFYRDTIEILPRQEMVLAPQLARPGQPQVKAKPITGATPTCDGPGPGYNTDKLCFDVRPRPVAPTLVPVSGEGDALPRPSVLWIRVSADGKSLEVRTANPSNDPTFEAAARQYALQVDWNPATKDGTPVEAWTQWQFSPKAP